MSFLMPFYIAGLAALSLPILFHLIRRRPKGQLAFSSLMFLRPSPPRLTRRSRLDHLLLLFLRALALCLLALAFARPFLREAAELDVATGRGRRVAVVVDTSASMRRGDLWTQTIRRVDETLDELGPIDQVALFAFDTRVRSLVDFDEGIGSAPERRAAIVRSRLGEVAPTWAATDLGNSLVTVADALEGFNDTRALDAALEIVLVSDLQEGSRLDELQAYEWPADVRLTVKTVALPGRTNAGVALRAGTEEPFAGERHRARVINDAESSREHFQLRWAAPDGTPVGKAISVYVPPGQSRVIPVPRPEQDSKADRLVLSGDDHDFDNTFYFVPRRLEKVAVTYVGRDAADDPQAMRYYLSRALDASHRYEVSITQSSPEDALQAGVDQDARLIVVTEAANEDLQRRLRRYVSTGGTVLYVLKDAMSARALDGIMSAEEVPPGDRLDAREANTVDYAMLSEIDFAHPLFASFADPRFNDFTKIRFWKHRQVDVPERSTRKVLARFDNGDPALFEHRHGQGRLLVLTSGWHPSDSQLALSTKFVPLLGGMLEEWGGDQALDRPSYEVLAEVVLPGSRAKTAERSLNPGGAAGGSSRDDRPARTILRPDGSEVKLAADARAFTETSEPGIYRLVAGERGRRFAVNVAADESKTAPLEVAQLEQFGVRLRTQTEEGERSQQLRDLELEGRQKLWRWLIAGALGVLILETWLAGLLSRPRREPAESE